MRTFICPTCGRTTEQPASTIAAGHDCPQRPRRDDRFVATMKLVRS